MHILDRIDDIALIKLGLSDQYEAAHHDCNYDACHSILSRLNDLTKKSAELHRHLKAIQADPTCGDKLADFAADVLLTSAEFISLRAEMDARAEIEAELDAIAHGEIDEHYRTIEMFDAMDAREFGMSDESLYVFEA